MTQMTQRVVLLVAAGLLVSYASRAATPKFYDDDPIWREPITQDVKSATRYEPDLVYQSLENLFTKPVPTATSSSTAPAARR
jgi:hypothetical protein